MNARIPGLRIVAQNQHALTVEPYGFPMHCVFEYEAGEPPILFPTDRAHPGTPDNAQLLECWIGAVNIYEMLYPQQIERLEELLLEAMQ